MEFLFELLFELFGEIFFTVLGESIGVLATTIDGDSKLKRRLKMILTYIVLSLTILLIVMSVIYSKTFLIIISSSYMAAVLIIRLFKRLNLDNLNNRGIDIFLNILRRVVRYSYHILLIVFTAIYLTNKSARIWIIVLSSISLVVWISIDIFKIWKKANYFSPRIDETDDWV